MELNMTFIPQQDSKRIVNVPWATNYVAGQVFGAKADSAHQTITTQSVVTASTSSSWYGISIAPNNLEALACVYNGQIYRLSRTSTSVDWATATQSVVTASTSSSWQGISMAPNNLEALACVYNGQIYRLNNLAIPIGTTLKNNGTSVDVLLSKKQTQISSGLGVGIEAKDKFGVTRNLTLTDSVVVEV
jgi:uncharacterized membrane protein YbjE (DUF340 family)